MTAFNEPKDIASRACQRVGAERILGDFALVADGGEDSKQCQEIFFCYDKLRVAELRRNVWRFSIRNAPLRPVATTTMELVPDTYDATETYSRGSIVIDGSQVYLARSAVPISTPPSANPNYWQNYFGPKTVSLYDTSVTYYAGELVYTPVDDDGYHVYMSLQNDNSDTPTSIPDWDATVTYSVGNTVTYSAATWQSKTDLNLNNAPAVGAHWEAIPGTQESQQMGQKWLRLDATVRSMLFIYPLGSGPSEQSFTNNVFVLPYGYLRKAPQDPKAGSVSYLGRPGNRGYDDWLIEGDYILTRQAEPIVLRFAADIADVKLMDPLFCEMLACRVGLEVCEPITQSTGKIQTCGAMYKQFRSDAVQVNGIEVGSEEPALDDYLACRV